MDSYQAIYDAVRSRLNNVDIGEAVESAFREVNISHYVELTSTAYQMAAAEQERPSVLYKPRLFIDGSDWCALYGENLQDGVAGFGGSPAEAMHSFDRAWHTNLPDRES